MISALLRGAPVPRSRILTIAEQKALGIRDGYNALVSALNSALKALEDHNRRHPQLRIPAPAVPRETVIGMAELIKYELLGEARRPAKWTAKLVEPGARAVAAVRTT